MIQNETLINQNETLLKYLTESNNLVDFWQRLYKNQKKNNFILFSILFSILFCISIPSILILTS